MMTRTRCLAPALLLGAACAGPVAAADLAGGGSVATPSKGFDLGYRVSGKLVARTGYSSFDASRAFREDAVEYAARMDLRTAHALVDWHALGGGLRLTGGLLISDHAVDGGADVAAGQVINGATVTRGGTLDLDVAHEPVTPYLGIGWGRRVRGWSMVNVAVDAGLMFAADPEVELRGDGIGGMSAADLEAEERQLQDDLSSGTVFPAVSLAIKYKF